MQQSKRGRSQMKEIVFIGLLITGIMFVICNLGNLALLSIGLVFIFSSIFLINSFI